MEPSDWAGIEKIITLIGSILAPLIGGFALYFAARARSLTEDNKATLIGHSNELRHQTVQLAEIKSQTNGVMEQVRSSSEAKGGAEARLFAAHAEALAKGQSEDAVTAAIAYGTMVGRKQVIEEMRSMPPTQPTQVTIMDQPVSVSVEPEGDKEKK